ncbi:MAG: HEAT repeat domain-containing protein [Gemmatimonadaceae bacterium]|nr:HEAT repeat domain-containing protein [Gemmatimonadaceae bacterium]
MTIPLAPAEELDEPPFPQSFVLEALKAFGKAVRAYQLYLPNNPMHARALDAVRESFVALWTQTDSIELQMSETEFLWEKRPVFEEADRATDSLPWTFYKDGIRELRMEKGFEGADLNLLLDILQRVRKASADDDDLLTMLWEAEFSALQYKYVDIGSEGMSELEGMEPSETRERIMAPAQAEADTPLKSSLAKMEDYDSTLYFLDDREIEYLQGEIKRDFSSDLRGPVLASLFDTFERESDPTVREEICGILDYFLLVLLSTTQFRTAAYLLREASTTAERAAEILQPQRQRLTDLAELLSDPSALSQLLQALEDTALRPPQVELNELFLQLKPRALETVLGWIGRSNNAELRALLENAASRLAASHTGELIRLIGSDDDVVVTEAIRRAAALKTPAAVPALGRLLTVAAPEIRIAAVTALTEIGSPGALQVLERAISDEDRDIRIAAVRALGARGSKPALPRIETTVKGKEIREANLTEKMAFFEAYGTLCGDQGIPLLDGLLHAKGFLAKKEDIEMRACAAMALGKIGSQRALDSLNKASADKEIIVRNAVSRAIRGAPTT